MKHGKTYSIKYLEWYTEKLAKAIKTQVMYLMVELGEVDELLVIGSFFIEGQRYRHSTVFLRQLCGPELTPVVLHLDCNEQLPQCSDPMKITWRPTTRLDFAQFERYSEIKVYTFFKHHTTNSQIEDKTKFIKDIVE
jgi:hypothetical protein